MNGRWQEVAGWEPISTRTNFESLESFTIHTYGANIIRNGKQVAKIPVRNILTSETFTQKAGYVIEPLAETWIDRTPVHTRRTIPLFVNCMGWHPMSMESSGTFTAEAQPIQVDSMKLRETQLNALSSAVSSVAIAAASIASTVLLAPFGNSYTDTNPPDYTTVGYFRRCMYFKTLIESSEADVGLFDVIIAGVSSGGVFSGTVFRWGQPTGKWCEIIIAFPFLHEYGPNSGISSITYSSVQLNFQPHQDGLLGPCVIKSFGYAIRPAYILEGKGHTINNH